jgi:DNA-binding PadR family transcriptional regulator
MAVRVDFHSAGAVAPEPPSPTVRDIATGPEKRVQMRVADIRKFARPKEDAPPPGPDGRPREREQTALRSRVSWAVLGLIIERPSYGYELLKRFKREYEEHLPIGSASHIYRSLDVLAGRGLIEETALMGYAGRRGGRQPRPCYRATPEGALRYGEWLEARACRDHHPSALFARQLAALAGNPEVALRVIDRCEQACMRDLARPTELAARARLCDRQYGLATRLVEEERRLAAEAALPWIRYARGEFEALAGDAA